MIVSEASSPEARVEAFICDFADQWAGCVDDFRDTVDFAVWRGVVAAVDERHFTAGSGCGNELSFSRVNPAHSPEREQIIDAVVTGDEAVITTKEGKYQYYQYLLKRSGSDWRIARLYMMFDPPGDPLIAEEERGALLDMASVDAPFGELPADVSANADRLFEEGREVERPERLSQIEVRRLGELQTRTGALGVRDFGKSGGRVTPLRRAIEPGSYGVDAAIAFGRVVALRLVVSERETVAWRAADFAGGGHVVGVDAGHVALFDVLDFAELTVGEKARLYEQAVVHAARPAASIIETSDGRRLVVVDSGLGDGGYPCYWGVDEDGAPTTLVVDFLVVAKFRTAGHEN